MKGEKSHSENEQNVYKSNKEKKHYIQPKKARNVDSKLIHDTIASIRRRVKNFKQSHLADQSRYNFAHCLRCLQEYILPAWRKEPENVKDYEEFLKLTLRKEPPEDVAQMDEYIDVISLGKRAREFQTLQTDVKRQILNCMEQRVVKSCSSLKEMAGAEVQLCVEEYTEHIAQHKADIETKWEELEKHGEEYKNFLSPFLHYVEQGEGHTDSMNKVCHNLLEVCKLIENWVNEDDGYPEKLMGEYESNKKIKENLNENVQQLERKKYENLEQLEKLQKRETRAYHNYTVSRKYKHILQSRQEQLEKRRERLNTKLEQKRSEQVSDGPEDGHSETKKAADFSRLETDLQEVEKQIKKLQRNFKPVNDRTYEHKVDAVTFRHQKEEIIKENSKLEEEIRSVHERIANVDRQNNILMKIRDMKLSEEAYRRFMRDKQKQEASQSGGSHRITEACQYAASIGKHWRELYTKLPFVPVRDADKRNHDISMLDYIGAKHDVTEKELAAKSLSKWLMFHRKATVNELVSALKETKFLRLASDIEGKFLS
ncbi:trichohyalin-like [Biomphalaria glabrata]|uniref:Trichohyalin-like n=1 Tax=Biomphalaria glabrata TaxID=6526 RepID=A0A9W3B9D0_BIOGL|nr:trichohyalin-like [Biomphalaria glabrata]XP_055896051.1 trichohyalin-like [Biomphalaria glabrata]XP_055896052.1 trichohyalin-like [Biomphalaria glabrata]